MKEINKVSEETYIVTMNVVSLFTNIPNSEGMVATKRALDKGTNKTVATKVIRTFLALLLTLKNFIFNCEFTFKSKDVQWEPFVHLMQIFSWLILKEDTYIH